MSWKRPAASETPLARVVLINLDDRPACGLMSRSAATAQIAVPTLGVAENDVRSIAPSALLSLFGRAKTSRNKRERKHAQVDCCCLCSDRGVISTGFATRRIPQSARHTGHSSPRSMRRRYAHGEWCLRENSHPPCRQQVRPRKDLLSRGTSLDAGHSASELGDRLASKRWPKSRGLARSCLSGMSARLSLSAIKGTSASNC